MRQTVIMQRVIERMSGWCHDNGLVINTSKTKILHVRPKRFPETKYKFTYTDALPNLISPGKISIETVSECTYLGVHIGEFLNSNKHIQYLQKKIRQGNYILMNLYYIKNTAIMKNVYYAIVESHLRYGITAWGSARWMRMFKILHNKIINLLSKADIQDKFLSIEKIYKVWLFIEFDMKEFNILVNHRYETRYKASKKVKTLKFFKAYGKFTLPNILSRIIN